MEAIAALQNAYGDGSDSENSGNEIEVKEEELLHLKPLTSQSNTNLALANLNANPEVITKVCLSLCVCFCHKPTIMLAVNWLRK